MGLQQSKPVLLKLPGFGANEPVEYGAESEDKGAGLVSAAAPTGLTVVSDQGLHLMVGMSFFNSREMTISCSSLRCGACGNSAMACFDI